MQMEYQLQKEHTLATTFPPTFWLIKDGHLETKNPKQNKPKKPHPKQTEI